MCVCVCLTLPAPPTPRSVLPMFIAQYFNQRGATPTCVRIASDHCPRLHPPCGSRGTLCVCVFAIACSPNPPLRPPDVHSPLIYLVGATPTCVKIASDHCPRLHPPCASQVTLCVCVFAIACSPHPPLRPPNVRNPLS